MFLISNKIAAGMALLRFFSSSIEFSAAMLMLYFGTVEKAMQVNAVLAMVGPIILISVTSLGLIGLAGKISVVKIGMIATGVVLILIGARN